MLLLSVNSIIYILSTINFAAIVDGDSALGGAICGTRQASGGEFPRQDEAGLSAHGYGDTRAEADTAVQRSHRQLHHQATKSARRCKLFTDNDVISSRSIYVVRYFV